MSVPQSPQLKNALWENKAHEGRANAIPNLSRILGVTISPSDFTGRAEFEQSMERCRNIKVREQRFPIAKRDQVLSLLENIPSLKSSRKTSLFFARSSDIGGLRLRSSLSAETLMSLLDWDGDDVFVFDTSDALVVHVDRGEDWLRPETMSTSPREMLYIVSIPKG